MRKSGLGVRDECFRHTGEVRAHYILLGWAGTGPDVGFALVSRPTGFDKCESLNAEASCELTLPAMPDPYQDVSEKLGTIRAPINQLLAGALRAEKALKASVDKAKKLSEKASAKAMKAKVAEPSTATLPLFDQGINHATPILQHKLADLTKAESPAEPDLSRPFIVRVEDWVASALQEKTALRVAVDDFKTQFDLMRAQQKGSRASKALDLDAADVRFDFGLEVGKMFKRGSVVGKDALEACAQQQIILSVFGIDATYDKVSSECAGMACVRLNTAGARCVMITCAVQLVGYMQRKGVEGVITTSRMSGFFRSLGISAIADFKASCSLETATVGPGDALYLPPGAIVAELCHTCNIGLRWPIIVHGSVSPSIGLAFQRRQEELEKLKGMTDKESLRASLSSEAAVVAAIMDAMSKKHEDPPADSRSDVVPPALESSEQEESEKTEAPSEPKESEKTEAPAADPKESSPGGAPPEASNAAPGAP